MLGKVSSSSFLQESPSVNLLVKLPGGRCNLCCDYCFEHSKSHVSEQTEQFVSPSLICKVIRQLDARVNLVLHGGEPLLASIHMLKDLFSGIESCQDRIESVHLQTNGTLLTQQIVDLLWERLKKWHIEIAISLDGPNVLNKHRITKTGAETFQSVRDAFSLLERNGISSGLLSVIHRGSLDAVSDYIAFLESISNIRFVKLNPLHVISETGMKSKVSISPVEFAKFVISAFSLYVEKGLYHRFPMEPCLSAIQVLSGESTHFCNFSFRKCNNFVCLYPDGTTSLCDSLPFFPYSIGDGGMDERLRERFDNLLSQCANCDLLDFCKGGCLGIRSMFLNSSDDMRNYCQSKRMLRDFFQTIICPTT